MTIAELCLLGTVMLTIVSIFSAKLDGRETYDNANPRDPGFYRRGLRIRSLEAHQNGFEAFPFFAAAVILSEMRGVPQPTVRAVGDGIPRRQDCLCAVVPWRPAGI